MASCVIDEGNHAATEKREVQGHLLCASVIALQKVAWQLLLGPIELASRGYWKRSLFRFWSIIPVRRYP